MLTILFKNSDENKKKVEILMKKTVEIDKNMCYYMLVVA